MPRMTIDIPKVVHDRLTNYQRNKKPHLSLKDVIVEAIDSVLEDYEKDQVESSSRFQGGEQLEEVEA
jgi:hypothetical protein